MKKMIFLAASAAFFVSGVRADDVVPNHIRHPLHAAAVKMLAPKSVVRMGATASATTSPVPDPTRAPGGLAGSNLIMGLSWTPYLSDTATYADNSVQQADIGATVAPLTDANLTNGLQQPDAYPSAAQSPALNVATSTATVNGFLYTSKLTKQPLIHMGVNMTDPNGQRWGLDPEALELGGEYVAPVAGNGATALGMSPGSVVSQSINCRPYGNYDAAACLHISDALAGREGSRAAIGANLESSVQALASYGAFENILLELNVAGPPPRLMLQNVTYDTTHVWMPGCGPTDTSGRTCTPLTSDQMAQLRVGMDLTTNSIPTEYVGKNILGGQTTHTVPNSYLFASFLSSWDTNGKYLTIRPGWAVMGDPNYGAVTASDGTVTYPAQTPPVSSLDTAWLPDLKVPTVLIGGSTNKHFTEHHVIMNSFGSSGGYSLPYNQVAHDWSDGETDFENFSPVDYSDVFQGPTISYSTGNTAVYQVKDPTNNCAVKVGANGQPVTETRYVNMDPTTHAIINLDACGVPNGHGAEPTADSYGFFVAGGFGLGGGSLLRLTGTAQEREIDATGFQVFGKGSPSGTAGAISEMGEFRGQADGNNLRLAFWTKRETAGSNGWYNTSVNLGGWVDGDAQNSWAGTSLSGSAMARIGFNSGGNLGGLDFYANNGTDILTLKGDGSTNVLGALNVTGGGDFKSQLTAEANFVMRGVQYFQYTNTAGTVSNAASVTVGSDGNLTFSPVLSGAQIISNLPWVENGTSTLNADVTMNGSATVKGNLTIGGNGGKTTLNDPVWLYNDLNSTGSATLNGSLTVGGYGGTTTLKDGVVFTSLAGTGNAYACLNASGQIYRSATACN